MRTGDTVYHHPSGETWVLAWASEEYVYPIGWPDTQARREDCELQEACEDDEHIRWVLRIAECKSNGFRERSCRSYLREMQASKLNHTGNSQAITTAQQELRGLLEFDQTLEGEILNLQDRRCSLEVEIEAGYVKLCAAWKGE